MYIESLAIEVTRRCNMKCPHCLRGDAEKLDLDTDYVRTLFKKIDGIGDLLLTGGEPSLVPNIIKKIVKIAEQENVEIGNFCVVTNAKKVTKQFIFSLIDLYVYCSDNEVSNVCWSNDGYHDEINEKNIELLRALKFSSPRNLEDREKYLLISQGRATSPTNRDVRQEIFEFEEEDERLIGGTLYLNCNGDIVLGCDYSYEMQDYNILCNVEDFNLEVVLDGLGINIGVGV
jgi:hypothetical protein